MQSVQHLNYNTSKHSKMNKPDTTDNQNMSRKSEVFVFRTPAIGKRTGRELKKRDHSQFLAWSESTQQEQQFIIPKQNDSVSFSEIKRVEEINDSRSIASRSSHRNARNTERRLTERQKRDKLPKQNENEKNKEKLLDKAIQKENSALQSKQVVKQVIKLVPDHEKKQELQPKQQTRIQSKHEQEQRVTVSTKQQQKTDKQQPADRRITTRSTSHQFEFILPPQLRNIDYQPDEPAIEKREGILKSSKIGKSSTQQADDPRHQRPALIPMDIDTKVEQPPQRQQQANLRNKKETIYSKTEVKDNKPTQNRKTKQKAHKTLQQQYEQLSQQHKKRKADNHQEIKVQHQTVSEHLSRNLRTKRNVGPPGRFFANEKRVYNQKGQLVSKCVATQVFLQVLGFDNIKQIEGGQANYSSNSMQHKFFLRPYQKIISVGIDQEKLASQLGIFLNFDRIVISSYNQKPLREVQVKIDNFAQQKLQQQIVIERHRKERIEIQNISDKKVHLSITIHRPAKS